MPPDRTVAVVGDAAARAAEAAGAATVVADSTPEATAAAVAAGPDLAVAAGADALAALVAAGVAAPVLVVDGGSRHGGSAADAAGATAPVDEAGASHHATAGVPAVPAAATAGVPTVPADAAAAAVEAALADDADTVAHPVYAVAVDGERVARLVLDATLVTAEPAHISEYAVRVAGVPLAQFRADGVVVGTPAGSPGYLSAAGGPVLQAGTGVVGVAPVGRFSTERTRWVVGPEELSVSVEREETEVTLVADGRAVGAVGCGEGVAFERAGTVSVVVPDGSRGGFGWGGTEE